MNELHELRTRLQGLIKPAVTCDVVLEPKGIEGRCVLIGAPDSVAPYNSLCTRLQVELEVWLFVTSPWDSEGLRRLTNDIAGAMSAVAGYQPTPAQRAQFDRGSDLLPLDCYRFTVTMYTEIGD